MNVIKRNSIYYMFVSSLSLPCRVLPLLAPASAVQCDWSYGARHEGGDIGAFLPESV